MPAPTNFEKFLDFIGDVVVYSRKAVQEVQKTYTETVRPQLENAVAGFNTARDPATRQALLNKGLGELERLKNKSSAAVNGMFTAVEAKIQGMPTPLALRVANALAPLQASAAAKYALGLPELLACERLVDELHKQSESNPNFDLTPGLTELDDLINKAIAAVDLFDASEDGVKILIVKCQSIVGDLEAAVAARAEKHDLIVKIIANPTFPASDPTTVSIAELTATLQAADADFKAGQAGDTAKFANAATALSKWRGDADTTLTAIQKETKAHTAIAEEPASLRAQLRALKERAKSKQIWRVENPDYKDIVPGFEAALAAVDLRPCDMANARKLVETFKQLVG